MHLYRYTKIVPSKGFDYKSLQTKYFLYCKWNCLEYKVLLFDERAYFGLIKLIACVAGTGEKGGVNWEKGRGKSGISYTG